MKDTEFYRFINHLPFMVAYVDEHLRYRFINNKYAAHFGINDPTSIVGRHIRDVLGKELYSKLSPLVDRVLGGALETYEVEHTDVRGHLHTFRGTIIVVYDAEGNVRGYNVVIQDISEWKQPKTENG